MIEAMKLALDALTKYYDPVSEIRIKNDAITSLRQAIAKAEKQDRDCQQCGGKGCVACDARKQEPVAFASHGVVNWIADKQFQHEADLYANPQPKPEQEPVAWFDADNNVFYTEEDAIKTGFKPIRPLYIHSKPKPEDYHVLEQSLTRLQKRYGELEAKVKINPLTVEQLREHWQVAKVLDMTDAEIDFADYVLIARDIEALYGIKGEA